MKHVLIRHDNKRNQKPHTNTLNTNITRFQSWRNFLELSKTPAAIAIAAGFFIALAPVSVATFYANQSDTDVNFADMLPNEHETVPVTTAGTPAVNEETAPNITPVDKQTTANVAHDRTISISIESRQTTETPKQDPSQTPSVTVNGQAVTLPKNGTYRETYQDKDTKTNIRIRGTSDASSISIHTKTDVKEGD